MFKKMGNTTSTESVNTDESEQRPRYKTQGKYAKKNKAFLAKDPASSSREQSVKSDISTRSKTKQIKKTA